MSKELCFNIENKNLYLEQVLVDYMDIPIFFLCSGEKQYYVALCTDIDELKYIVVKLSLTDTYNLLHAKISMRDAILKQNEYWDIVSGEEISLDVVVKKNIDTIEMAALPEAGACFKILTKQMQLFVQKFDGEFFSAKYFEESNKKADINGMFINLPFDDMLKDIDQFTELLDYRLEKPQFLKIPLYDEKMNLIKKVEITFSRSENSERTEIDLAELYVNDMAIAA